MKQPDKPEIDHRTIKLLIGLIAITLPILTSFFAGAPLASISASYYETGWAQSIFIGFLFAIAAFLAAYNGKDAWEMVLSRIAAVAALGVALFPCDCDCHEVLVPYVHFIAAAIMFVILAGFCLIFYRRAMSKKAIQHNHEAGRRAWVYALSGIVIVASILTLAVDAIFGHFISDVFPRLVFFGEFAGLLAFGASWLTASHTVPLLAQEGERPHYFKGAHPHQGQVDQQTGDNEVDMANETTTTQRTKAVIAEWSEQRPESITLDTKLNRLRSNHLEALRQDVNREFQSEATFPITHDEWDEADPKTVRDVRNLAKKKLGEV